MNIIKVKSLCPECKKEIDADIELTEKVVMRKHCCSTYESIVEKRSDIYLTLKNTSNRLLHNSEQVFLDVTNDCNKSCDYCYHSWANGEISKNDIFEAIDSIPYSDILLTGGEPTVRNDLFEIIEYIKQKRKFPILNTNGIKLKDKNYVKRLRDLKCSITLTIVSDESIPAMDNMLSLGMYHTNVASISVQSLDDIPRFMKIAYSYKLLWNSLRLRGVLQKPFTETNIFLSDLWSYFVGRYNITTIDDTCFNNIYHLNTFFKGIQLRLISWPHIMNVDTTELNVSPYYYPNYENMVLANIKKQVLIL